MKLLKKGKVKEVYIANDDELEFVFTDNISVFDKVIPTKISHKGETLCRTSAYWFKAAEKLGIKTHFIKLTAPNRMRVKKLNIIPNYDELSDKTRNYLIPLEFIARYYVAGSLYDRIKNKELKPESLGLKTNCEVKYGDRLPEPFFEVTTKLEKTDRLLESEEALRLSGLSIDEYKKIKEIFFKIDEEMSNAVKQRGLIHVDGKKEFGFDEKREIILIDTFGTADEDRFWDAVEYKKSNFVELSKEFVRQYYKKIGYFDKLQHARKNNFQEPEIPPLPDDMVRKISALYIELFERITGEKF